MIKICLFSNVQNVGAWKIRRYLFALGKTSARKNRCFVQNVARNKVSGTADLRKERRQKMI